MKPALGNVERIYGADNIVAFTSPDGRLKKVSTVLQRSRDLLETSGWCQGDMKTTDGTHCALGVLYEHTRGFALIGDPDDPDHHYCWWEDLTPQGRLADLETEAERFLDTVVQDLTDGKVYGVIEFNDRSGGSKEAVLDLYDRAIKLAKAAGR